jgi:hypothetical protein
MKARNLPDRTFGVPSDSLGIGKRRQREAPAFPKLMRLQRRYLRDTLQLPRGSLFDVNAVPDVREAEFYQVMSALKDSGYKLTPGRHVGILSGPKPNDD